MWDCTKMYFVVAQCASSLRVSVVICVFRALWYNDILNIWKSPRSLSFICNCFLERTLPNTNVITFVWHFLQFATGHFRRSTFLGPCLPFLIFHFDLIYLSETSECCQLCSCSETGSGLHGLLSPTSDASPCSMQHALLINEETRLKPFINTFEPLVNKPISHWLLFVVLGFISSLCEVHVMIGMF